MDVSLGRKREERREEKVKVRGEAPPVSFLNHKVFCESGQIRFDGTIMGRWSALDLLRGFFEHRESVVIRLSGLPTYRFEPRLSRLLFRKIFYL